MNSKIERAAPSGGKVALPELLNHLSGRNFILKGGGIEDYGDEYVIPRSHCPKFKKCSAPICPVDPDWHTRVHLKSERVCFYLREAVKAGVAQNLRGALPDKLVEAIAEALPRIIDRYGPIRKQLLKSAKTSSKFGIRPGDRKRAAA